MKLTLDTLKHYTTEEGECLLWNLGVNSDGTPQARIDGKVVKVRRYVYETLMNKPVLPSKRVSSVCANPLCVSPKCLRANTYSEINRRVIALGRKVSDSAAMRRNGIKSGRTKLHGHIEAIRLSDEPTRVLAERYGVNPSTIRAARNGSTWGTSWL